MGTKSSYRQQIYKKYSSEFQKASQNFQPTLGDRFLCTFEHYFRGWLPQRKEAAIVDLACGGGIFLYYLKKCGYTNIAGVDICQEQVEICKQITSNVTVDSVFTFLEKSSEAFDLITVLNIIEHLHKEEVLDFLEGCRRALKPGGRLILMTPNADALFAATMRYGDFTHETLFTPRSLAHLLRLGGFFEIETRETGPIPWGYSMLSSLRYVIWQMIRLGLMFYHRIETGSPGSKIFTRVFTISATKNPDDRSSGPLILKEDIHAEL